MDDGPVIGDDVSTVDETNLDGGAIVVNGSVTTDFGQDGAGSVVADGTFTSGGSQANGALTSNGVAVVVTFDAATNTYTGAAGGTTVFTMVLNNDGCLLYTSPSPRDRG